MCVEPVVAGAQSCQNHLTGPVKKVVCILLLSGFQRCFDDGGLFLVMDAGFETCIIVQLIKNELVVNILRVESILCLTHLYLSILFFLLENRSFTSCRNYPLNALASPNSVFQCTVLSIDGSRRLQD